jgi:type 2 lantibiotic biosynthesis protein LanM
MPQKIDFMNQRCFQSHNWYNAVTLTERLESLRANRHNDRNTEINNDLAQSRMKCWRSQSPLLTDSWFMQRLATEEISFNEFFHLLGEPTESVSTRFPHPPSWLINIAQAFSSPNHESDKSLQSLELSGFLLAIKPMIDQGLKHLRQGIKALDRTKSDLAFTSSSIETILLANLSKRLLWMLSRTMVLELNVARLQEQLQGNTSEERFNSFIKQLCQPNKILELLQEYPILARQLTICIDQWVTFSLEFLQHLCNDWDEILAMFNQDSNPGVLVEVNSSVGDKHRGGRAVIIAKFSSGFQIVYKPRSLAIDIHFQELLTWLNRRGEHPSFRTLKIIERGSYGWVEFVSAGSCNSTEEIQRFYERQGGYLALLYVLGGTDCHSENIIAAGEYPILIDIESLFQPNFPEVNCHQSNLIDSVLNVGLLPENISGKSNYEDCDDSGLGAQEGQLTPYEIPYWEQVGSDKMNLQRKKMKMMGDLNRPTLNDSEINLSDYQEEIVAGFTNVYCLLLKYRDELISENSLLDRFAKDEVRVIIRHSQLYSVLLQESFHPNLLRNALDRDRFFDKLWLGIEHNPYLAMVIPSEKEDLHQGDIPIFKTYPNSCDLWSGSNRQILNFLDEPGMVTVKRRLKQMGTCDLAQQLYLIRTSLATPNNVAHSQVTTSHIAKPQTTTNHEQLSKKLLLAARKVGERLEELAIHGKDGNGTTWFDLHATDKSWSIVTLGHGFHNLYDDIPGVVFFLAYLGAVTKEERYTNLAKSAFSKMYHHMKHTKLPMTLIGGFAGLGAVIYTFVHLSILWQKPELLAEAEAVVKILPGLIEQDEELGILTGTAGCLVSLLSLYKCKPSQRTLNTAIKCGDHLLTHAQTMKNGIGWVINEAGAQPLAGFAYGSAGIAWALLELATLTGKERFQSAALKTIAYERSLFSSEIGNWFDLRESQISDLIVKGDQEKFMTAWCHGAPGIGLARLNSLLHLDNAEIREEINAALNTTLANGFGNNHSLCHGDLGNLEFLLQASEVLGEPQWNHYINRLANITLDTIYHHGWNCGIPLKAEVLGLMTGISGIGYGLLRLAAPKLIPSVLMLESPKLNSLVQQK